VRNLGAQPVVLTSDGKQCRQNSNSGTAMTAPYRRRPRFINGIEMPREADLRTVFGRRLTLLIRAYSAELGGNLAEADKALVRQVSSLQVRIEQLDGREVAADEIIRLSSEHRRLLTALRSRATKAKPAAPGLQDYIREKYGEPESTEESEGADA
jgi:hypothetical protein